MAGTSVTPYASARSRSMARLRTSTEISSDVAATSRTQRFVTGAQLGGRERLGEDHELDGIAQGLKQIADLADVFRGQERHAGIIRPRRRTRRGSAEVYRPQSLEPSHHVRRFQSTRTRVPEDRAHGRSILNIRRVDEGGPFLP